MIRAILRGPSQQLLYFVLVALLATAHAQTPNERTFPQSRATVTAALTSLQSSLSGRLPTLDGFADAGDHPLDRYQRGFYQTTFEVSTAPSGGSLVRVHSKITAWYADPASSKSGYQLLKSNGRLETDLLDQLAETLAKSAPASTSTTASSVQRPASQPKPSNAPAKPSVKFPSLNQSLAEQERASRADATKGQSEAEKANLALQNEVHSLEEILKNQAHPTNLVAVKKSGTPVVESPSVTAKPLFLASLHDEFEMLDFNADWVHVRISGLSRGWIWRNSVEMPEGIADTPGSASPALTPAADLFQVSREEVASFPGDWAPLRGKTVKIVSVQKTQEASRDAGPRERLEYSKFLFEKNFTEISSKAKELSGIVLIFDSADGGMVAANSDSLQQWKAGKLSDSAFWHKCFFDPPETFESGAGSDH